MHHCAWPYAPVVPAVPDSYAWLSAGVLGVAGCITVIPGADMAKVEAAFGCDPMSGTAPRYAISSPEHTNFPRLAALNMTRPSTFQKTLTASPAELAFDAGRNTSARLP